MLSLGTSFFNPACPFSLFLQGGSCISHSLAIFLCPAHVVWGPQGEN